MHEELAGNNVLTVPVLKTIQPVEGEDFSGAIFILEQLSLLHEHGLSRIV
jgi:hypothetical protein